MHDRSIEERLRSALRSEADALPLTITAEELDRRLSLRRRDRMNRRFGLLAAGVAAIAVTGVFAMTVGPFRGPTVATTPEPSGLPSAVQPSARPSSVPSARPSAPLGAVGQAVLVRPVGEDIRRPEAFDVSLFDPVDASTEVIATLPGSILPDDGWLDGGEKPPVVSRSGYLAMEFTRGPNEDDRYAAIAIVDLFAPAAEPWLIDRYRDPRWGPTEQLAVIATDSEETRTATIVPRSIDPSTTEPGVIVGQWSSEADVRFLATKDSASGYLGLDGTFTAATDLPAVYQRTGRDRVVGADAHTLGMGCDSGASGSGCILGEWASHDDPPIRAWYTETEAVRLADHVWAADGRGVLLLMTTGVTSDRLKTELGYAPAPDDRRTVGRLEVPDWALPAILGISAEPDPGRPTITAIGDSSGQVFSFLLDDGTVVPVDGIAWFAGWADDPEPYDPD